MQLGLYISATRKASCSISQNLTSPQTRIISAHNPPPFHNLIPHNFELPTISFPFLYSLNKLMLSQSHSLPTSHPVSPQYLRVRSWSRILLVDRPLDKTGFKTIIFPLTKYIHVFSQCRNLLHISGCYSTCWFSLRSTFV